MNTLEQFIKVNGMDEIGAMNALQDQGSIISDCCVMARDVASVNHDAAIRFLRLNKQTILRYRS